MVTRAELNDRARRRSIDERLRTFRVSEDSFLVKSRAYDPGSHHVVTVNPRTGDVTTCSNCPGWHHRQSCTHAQAVERRLEREGRKSRPTRHLDHATVETSTTRGQLYREAGAYAPAPTGGIAMTEQQAAADFWTDADVIYSYTWQQAVEDGMLVEIFKNRWPELTDGVPLLATRGTFEAFSLAALQEMWNDFVRWAKSEDRVFGAIFETRMNGQRVWVTGNGDTFTILFPHEN